jgi:N-glycosyltransferase
VRALFTTQPGHGHFHPLVPLVPLARALAGAGHEVGVACAPAFGPTVAASGLRALPAGWDWLAEGGTARGFPDLADLPGPQRLAGVVEVTARRMADDPLALASEWPFDVIVRETMELGRCLAAERLGVPHAVVETVTLQPGQRALIAAPSPAPTR